MPTTPISNIIDAIAADLAALSISAPLPAHSVWLYVDPPVLRPDLGTMLAIFPKTTDYDVLATNGSYSEDNHIVVAWYVPMLIGLETGGVGDPAIAKAALADAETIVAQLRTYATAIPGLAGQSEGTLETGEYGTLAGAPVWAARITLKVEHWPGA